MKVYRITIRANKYPTDYNVQASNWGTAVARAIREWQKEFKGSKATELHIKAIKSTPLLSEEKQHE